MNREWLFLPGSGFRIQGVKARRSIIALFALISLFGVSSIWAQNWDYRLPKAARRASTRLPAKTMTGEDMTFRRTIDALDGRSDKRVAGVDMLPAAVSAQTGVPISTLKAQQAKTGLSYGELLVADSLAVGSGNSFARILRMRSKTQTWAELSLKLRINPGSLMARARAASLSIDNAVGRYERQHRETIYGLDVVRTRNSQSMPRPFGRFPTGHGG